MSITTRTRLSCGSELEHTAAGGLCIGTERGADRTGSSGAGRRKNSAACCTRTTWGAMVVTRGGTVKSPSLERSTGRPSGRADAPSRSEAMHAPQVLPREYLYRGRRSIRRTQLQMVPGRLSMQHCSLLTGGRGDGRIVLEASDRGSLLEQWRSARPRITESCGQYGARSC